MEQEISLRGVVKAVCISREKGTEKRPIARGHFIPDFGIEQDAHGGKWHRQVSLLSYDKVVDFNKRGACVADGDFGENGNPAAGRNRGAADDPDRQGMPQPLCHPQAGGRLHHAPGGGVCGGAGRRGYLPR